MNQTISVPGFFSARLIVWCCSVFCIFIAIMVLVGWQFEISSFKSILPQFISMKPNTAIGIFLLAVGILLNRSSEESPPKNFFLKILPPGMVLLLAGLTLFEYILNTNFGIDEFFFFDIPPVGFLAKYPPGRMAPITAILFILLSSSQFLMFNRIKPSYQIAQGLIFLSCITAFQAMMSYFWGVSSTLGIAYHTQMAFHTTVAVGFLSIGLLATRPFEGWIGFIGSQTAGGSLVPKLLASAIIVPPMVMWLNAIGQSSGLYGEDFGEVLKVTGNMIFFVIVVLTFAHALHIAEVKKQQEEKKSLQLLVEQETSLAIKESETRLRAIFEATFDAILGMDANGCITDWNSQAEKMFGWDKHEVMGKKLSDFIVPPKYKEAYLKDIKHFITTGIGPIFNKTIEIEALRKNGELFPIQLSVNPIKLNGTYIFMAFISDITERKKNEAELIRAKQNALDAVKTKSIFLANMSHEIRTPLNGIIGMTDLLLETTLDEQQTNYARIVQTSGSGLLGIINDILDFTKSDEGKLDLEIIEFNPFTLVEEQAELLSSRALAKGITILTHLETTLPTRIKGDPGRIGQVLLNLISNAIKFTNEGNIVIKLQGKPIDDKKMLFKFSIIESGIGIATDKLTKLFQPFTQADETTARKYGGTGLGLSICRQLVELMNGRISVKSVEGEGSVFFFEIPLEVVPESVKKLPVMEKQLRVLIVDDDPVVREILSYYLNSWKMTVISTVSGEAALELLSDQTMEKIDLAIIDSSMPLMDGLELARRIKANDKFRTIPLILLTAFDINLHLPHEVQKTFSGFISKPFKQSSLYDVISVAMHMNTQDYNKNDLQDSICNDFSHFRILVAEDNQVNQLLTLTQLKKLGFSAQVAANGKEVIASMAIHDFDLILMDCQMPEMDGYEATRIIRINEKLTGKHITIVALTANAMKQDEAICLEAGMDDFISKPTKREVLNTVLKKWLNKS